MVEEISPTDLRQRLDDDDPPQVIDVRPPEQFAAGHVPGAVNVPLSELPDRIDEVDWADDVVVACPLGESSVQAARLIHSFAGAEDARIRSLAGGYDAWEGDLERQPASETASAVEDDPA